MRVAWYVVLTDGARGGEIVEQWRRHEFPNLDFTCPPNFPRSRPRAGAWLKPFPYSNDYSRMDPAGPKKRDNETQDPENLAQVPNRTRKIGLGSSGQYTNLLG